MQVKGLSVLHEALKAHGAVHPRYLANNVVSPEDVLVVEIGAQSAFYTNVLPGRSQVPEMLSHLRYVVLAQASMTSWCALVPLSANKAALRLRAGFCLFFCAQWA